MTKKHSTKRSLIASALALCLCLTTLIGTTFAWFTDSVTSSGNIIKSGTLDVEMYWAKGKDAVPVDDGWTDASTGAIFDYDNWEPGYAEARHIKIVNKGALALKYAVRIIPEGEVSELADAIDVYYAEPAIQVVDRELTGLTKIGTLSEVLAGMETTANGNLAAGEFHTITIVLKMQESAGNKYQDKSIGTSFSVQLVATQLMAEEDNLGDDYDEDADLPYISVPVVLPAEDVTDPVELNADGMKVEVPAAVINSLSDEVTSIAVEFYSPVIDAESNTISFSSVELVDQNGNKIDLEGNTNPITVTLPAQTTIAANEDVIVLHDGEIVATAVVAADGSIAYTANHFCEVTVVAATKVGTADELKAAIAAGENVQFAADITMSSKLNITADTVIYGMGYTFTHTGGSYAIDVDNGVVADLTVNDLTINGNCQRGINYNVEGGKLTIDNVTIDGKNVNYAINLRASSDNAIVTINDSNIIGNTVLNVWGENTVIVANNTNFRSTYVSDVEACAVIKFNQDTLGNAATGSMMTITGGSVISDADTVAIEVVPVGVTVDVSAETVIKGSFQQPVALVVYEGQSDFYTCHSFAQAVARAKNDTKATIVLIKDIALTKAVTIDGAVKLDLNGCNITYTVPATEQTYHAIIVKGDLTVSGKGTIALVDNSGAEFNAGYQSTAISVEGGTLTLNEGVVVSSKAGAEMAYAVDVNTTLGKSVLNVNGATLESSYIGVRIFNNNNTEKGIVNYNSGVISGERKGYDIWAQNMSNPAENAVVNIADGISYTSEALSGVMYYFD